jgi:hypothetical protein
MAKLLCLQTLTFFACVAKAMMAGAKEMVGRRVPVHRT